ncbi:hypothetical protein B484DRAFT_31634, partial [Ochromonadaceae sp. CCMP2298]
MPSGSRSSRASRQKSSVQSGGAESGGVQSGEGDANPTRSFLRGVIRSIGALNRAVGIAEQMQQRSANTDYYLHAARVLKRLREGIVGDDWADVRACLCAHQGGGSGSGSGRRGSGATPDNRGLPPAALQEVRAVREALQYRHYTGLLTAAMACGAISGPPHEYHETTPKVSYLALDAAVLAAEQQHFQDPSAALLLEFAKRLLNVRYYFAADRWDDDAGEFEDTGAGPPSTHAQGTHAQGTHAQGTHAQG